MDGLPLIDNNERKILSDYVDKIKQAIKILFLGLKKK